jgi:hypothetical protein
MGIVTTSTNVLTSGVGPGERHGRHASPGELAGGCMDGCREYDAATLSRVLTEPMFGHRIGRAR